MRNSIIFLIFSVISSSFAYLEQDGWLNIELLHAVTPQNPEKFSFRGNISISSISSGLSSDDHALLTRDEKEALVNLAENNEFYRVKAIVSYPDGSQNTFLTSTKACSIVSAQLTDVFWISIDSQGFVTGITETVLGQEPGRLCWKGEFQASDLVEFTSDVLIRQMELGPIPDTASFIQKVEREREAREKGEVKDNRSFFAKYWMYIVPVVVLVMISGATNPEAGGAK